MKKLSIVAPHRAPTDTPWPTTCLRQQRQLSNTHQIESLISQIVPLQEIQCLLDEERYNPAIIPQLEAYVLATTASTYDLDASLALLKVVDPSTLFAAALRGSHFVSSYHISWYSLTFYLHAVLSV